MNALKPNFIARHLPSLKQDAVAKKKGATDEERHLSFMAGQKGWAIFKEFTNEVLRDLDKLTDVAMSNGIGFEEIGRNAVVVNMSKDIIKKIVNKVEDAKEACTK